MKKIYQLVLLVSCLLYAVTSFAIEVKDLYDISVPMTNRNKDQQSIALQKGFSKVLFRLTGNDDLTSRDEIKAAISQVDKYVSSFSFQEISESIEDENDLSVNQEIGFSFKSWQSKDNVNFTDLVKDFSTSSGNGNKKKLYLDIKFNEHAVNNLLESLQISFLNKNRPLTVVWLVKEEHGEYQFVGGGRTDDFNQAIEKAANENKIPIVLPLLDLADKKTITEESIIYFDNNAVLSASNRYNADAILVGRIKKSGINWLSNWRLAGKLQKGWHINESDFSQNFTDSMNELLTAIVENYTTSINNKTDMDVKMLIVGIKNINDYTKVVSHLRALPSVNSVEELDLDFSEATFKIKVQGSHEDLIRDIKFNRVLEKKSDSVETEDVVVMKYGLYQWK